MNKQNNKNDMLLLFFDLLLKVKGNSTSIYVGHQNRLFDIYFADQNQLKQDKSHDTLSGMFKESCLS